MKEFEYWTFQVSDFSHIQSKLNQCGREGWELIGFSTTKYDYGVIHNFVLKREKL